MKKKKVYWYGIRAVSCDLSINKAVVSKVTAKQIVFDDTTENVFYRGSVWKSSSYEKWFPTRKEAVAAKLEMLEENLETETENVVEAENCLKEFRGRENV